MVLWWSAPTLLTAPCRCVRHAGKCLELTSENIFSLMPQRRHVFNYRLEMGLEGSGRTFHSNRKELRACALSVYPHVRPACCPLFLHVALCFPYFYRM